MGRVKSELFEKRENEKNITYPFKGAAPCRSLLIIRSPALAISSGHPATHLVLEWVHLESALLSHTTYMRVTKRVLYYELPKPNAGESHDIESYLSVTLLRLRDSGV